VWYGSETRLQQTEVGAIPEDWCIAPVSQLGETKRGASSLCIKYRQSGGVRLIRINDFFENNPVFVEPTAEIMRFALDERDLLFAGTGASAGATYLPKQEWLGLPHSYNAPRIRVFKGHSKEFLLYSLQSGYVIKQQRAWFVGNAQPFLDTKAISNFSIAVPATPTEERAIAEALSDVDALLGGLDRFIAKKRDLKRAAMQQLLNPSPSWEIGNLESIADVIDPHPSHRAPNAEANGIPFVGIGDLDEDGEIIGTKIRLVDPSVHQDHRARYDLTEELIGLGRVASIGKVVRLRPATQK
jgi:Type I restriction modification DNA specificity domain